MKNRIIKGNGKANVVKMDMSGYSSFAEFKAAAEAGTLMADIVANDAASAVTQAGTPLTAENLLTNSAAEGLGLSSADPTVNEAFESLAITQEVIDAFSAIGIDLTNVGGVVQAVSLLAGFLGGLVTWRDYSLPALTFTAGSEGSYAGRKTVSVALDGYTPIAAVPIVFAFPGSYNLTLSLDLDNRNLDAWYYRARSTAFTGSTGDSVRVFFAKDF